jgi:hypothetical protein
VVGMWAGLTCTVVLVEWLCGRGPSVWHGVCALYLTPSMASGMAPVVVAPPPPSVPARTLTRTHAPQSW